MLKALTAENLAAQLREVSYHGVPVQVEVDSRDLGGGVKNWEWIKKGIPIRIEIGPRDLAQGTVALSPRGEIEIDARGGRSYLSVTSTESDSLRILSKPETVSALQELTRIAVQTKTGAYSRLILDVGGSRDARAAELAALVDRAVQRIEDGAASAALPPMSSYERKLVHDIVSERGYVSESEGEGRDRHTVIRK